MMYILFSGWSPVMYDYDVYTCVLGMPYHIMIISFIIIVVQGYNFEAITNNCLHGVASLKVQENDEEHNWYTKHIWLQQCVYERVMWYSSYLLKSPREV